MNNWEHRSGCFWPITQPNTANACSQLFIVFAMRGLRSYFKSIVNNDQMSTYWFDHILSLVSISRCAPRGLTPQKTRVPVYTRYRGLGTMNARRPCGWPNRGRGGELVYKQGQQGRTAVRTSQRHKEDVSGRGCCTHLHGWGIWFPIWAIPGTVGPMQLVRHFLNSRPLGTLFLLYSNGTRPYKISIHFGF